MSKAQRKFNLKDELDKPHHQVKQFKKAKEKKSFKRLENALRSKDVSRLLELEDTI